MRFNWLRRSRPLLYEKWQQAEGTAENVYVALIPDQLLSFIISRLQEMCRSHRKFLKPLHTSETINNTGSPEWFPWVKIAEHVSPNNSRHLLKSFVWKITRKLILIFLRCCNCSSKKLTSGKRHWEQTKLLVLPGK